MLPFPQEHSVSSRSQSPEALSRPAALLRVHLSELTPSLAHLGERLALAAAHDLPVLLTGETGTGKTMLARLIHEHSARRRHRFMVVPCGAIAPGLLEAEFFGHARGAFTGAAQAREGRFAAVGAGTLLLDEIDTLPLDRQTSLLRVVETGEFEPVGSDQTQRCRARIIAASNWQLEECIEKGAFRRDLYYRLNPLTLHLPPLRERVEDIAPLACHFAARFSVKYCKPAPVLHPRTLEVLRAFPWPGNIRQLENVIHQTIVTCEGSEILPEHLPALGRSRAAVPNVASAPMEPSLSKNR